MTVAERREVFANEVQQRRRRRQLLGTLIVAAFAVFLALATEVLPVPDWVTFASAAAALVALAAGGRAVLLLGRDDRRRRRDAEAIVDLTGSLLVVLDHQSRVRLANPAACAAFGRPEGDILGEAIQDAVIASDERDASREAFRQIIEGEVDARGSRGVRRVQRPDGTCRDIAWHIAPRHDEHDGIAGLLLSGEDVTAERLREQDRDREREDLEQLRRLAQEVAAHDDARRAVVDRVSALVDASFTGLAEPKVDGSGDWTYTVATDDQLLSVDLPAGSPSGALAVVRDGEPLFIADAVGDARVSAALVQTIGVRTLLFQPVKRGDQVIGVLTAGWTTAASEPDERRAQLLQLAGGEAAIALQRIETQQQLKDAALTDALTGVPNRRAFDAELVRVLSRAARDGGPVTLAVMDLNEFKALNDRCGHDAGDALLTACAGAWKATLRGGDMLARLGGDEFAAILPDCDGPAAESLIGRLHGVTPHLPGASVGLATWAGGTAFELYQAADRALYRDKEARRAGRITDPARLEAVERTGLFEHGSRPEIDRLTDVARDELALQGVYVNLVGAEKVRHISRPAGVAHDSAVVSDIYCELVVTTGRPLVVSDARAHLTLNRHPGIELGLIAYAGIPLTDGAGTVLGAVCAADNRPHNWSPDELRILDRLAIDISTELNNPRASTPPTSQPRTKHNPVAALIDP